MAEAVRTGRHGRAGGSAAGWSAEGLSRKGSSAGQGDGVRAAGRARVPQSRWSVADVAARAAAEGVVGSVPRATVRRWHHRVPGRLLRAPCSPDGPGRVHHTGYRPPPPGPAWARSFVHGHASGSRRSPASRSASAASPLCWPLSGGSRGPCRGRSAAGVAVTRTGSSQASKPVGVAQPTHHVAASGLPESNQLIQPSPEPDSQSHLGG